MRKQVAGSTRALGADTTWLDLEAIAEVEVSSEAPAHPVENALTAAGSGNWQAAAPGASTITLRFDAPLLLTAARLEFAEAVHERSQEWAISAVFADGTERELLRQGWNFSPSGSREQRERYTLQTAPVRALTLWIDPDRGQNRYPATLEAWRLAGRPA